MAAAAAAMKGSPAWAVVVVVAMMSAAVGALRAQSHTPDDPCLGSMWLEIDAAGRWSHPAAVTSEALDSPHPPAVTHIPWSSVREAAGTLGTELGLGLPLPVLTCTRSFSSCPAILPSPEAHCIRMARRGVCVMVDGVCKTLVVSVIEPLGCCCGEKEGNKLNGKITNVTLGNKAPGGVCVPLWTTAQEPATCCCGSEESNAMRTAKVMDVRQRNMCTVPIDDASGLVKGKDGEQSEGDGSSLYELTEKQIKEERNGEESDGDDSSLGEPTETQIEEETDGEESEGDDGGLSELTEKHLTEDSILEDVIAALVFLFVGAALVLIKNRVFKFTKKKRQQEDKDMESQETLVDETII